MPFPLFKAYVAWVKEKRQSQGKVGVGVSGRAAPPIELYVLGALRMLGRGTCLDGIKELSVISEAAMSVFFHDFCYYFRHDVFPRFVTAPRNEAELAVGSSPHSPNTYTPSAPTRPHAPITTKATLNLLWCSCSSGYELVSVFAVFEVFCCRWCNCFLLLCMTDININIPITYIPNKIRN